MRRRHRLGPADVRGRVALGCAALLACGRSDSVSLDMSDRRDQAAEERVDGAPARRPAAAATRWDSPVADLYALEGPRGEPLIFERAIAEASPEALGRLADALDRLDVETLRALPEAGRVALQNDLWGVAVRRGAATRTTLDGGRVDAALGRLVCDLALPPSAGIFATTPGEPPQLLAALPPTEGWEVIAEHARTERVKVITAIVDEGPGLLPQDLHEYFERSIEPSQHFR